LLNDTETGASKITGVDCILNGHVVAMYADDGAFDEASEAVSEVIENGFESGVYNVCVAGTDAMGNTSAPVCSLLAVYDPGAGFVTGGGWIHSPEGAYQADITLVGKANFGFVSKYQKGKSIPTGTTVFKFKTGDFHFSSENYEWLVVAGAKGKFKGEGTVNGGGRYGFMLTAVDAALTASTDVDLFRIKIWDMNNNDSVVYDNQLDAGDDAEPTTALGGGSIVIHKGKGK